MLDLNEAARQMEQNSLKVRGRMVRRFRRATGVDIEFMARLCGLTKSTLSKFERGLNDFRVETYARVLDAMDRVEAEQAEIVRFVDRVIDARKQGHALLAELAYAGIPWDNSKKLMEWIAEQTKARLERRERQAFAASMREHLEAKIAERDALILKLQKEKAELLDLLNVETDIALKTSEADSLREKIKARDSAESED